MNAGEKVTNLSTTSCTAVDVADMAGMIATLGEKLHHSFAAAVEALEWEHVLKTHPLGSGRIDNVLVSGMGGSAISGDLLAAALPDIAAPLVVVRSGGAPAWTGPRTLMLAISYSGSTEETLASVEVAAARGCVPVCVTSGGDLTQIASERRWPLVSVEGGLQPRAALGQLLGSAAAVLAKSGLDHPPETRGHEVPHAPRLAEQVEEAGTIVERLSDELKPDVPEESNLAKQLARHLDGRLPLIYGAGVTVASARRWKTQLNENAEVHAFVGELPEVNHNEIVGWHGDRGVTADAHAVALADPHGDPLLQRRLRVTLQALEGIEASFSVVEALGVSPLARAISALYIGDWTSYYLAILHGVDPTPVEAIQALKRRLATRDDEE